MREKLLHTAIVYFLRYGIKAVSVEDIARSLHISKRTLYEYFSSKTELLIESFQYGIQIKKKEIETNLLVAESPLEAILVIYTTAAEHTYEICSALSKEVERYSEIHELSNGYLSFLEQKWGDFFDRGIREDVLLPESNYKIIYNIFINYKEVLLQNDKPTEITQKDNNLQIVYSCLKGMCTEKGKRELIQLYETIKNRTI